MKSNIVVILIVLVAVAAGISSYFGRQQIAEDLNAKAMYVPEAAVAEQVTIKAEPVPLNPEDLAQSKVGALDYIAGWVLTSEHEDFGGWSGLVVKKSDLVAINDQGNWLEATVDFASDTPFVDARLTSFDGSEEPDKVDYDAESLVAYSGGYLVGFEQEHRLMQVKTVGTAAGLYDTGADLSGLSDNSGLEAITFLPDGRLLMFAENGRDIKGRTPAWISSGGAAQSISFYPPENYAPTDAASLPNGDVLLLVRHYSVMSGVSVKLLHIEAGEIASGSIRGRELATFKAPLTIDNMEGLDVHVRQDGTVRLFMISDDNFSARQKTLLLVFDWHSGSVRPSPRKAESE